MKQYKITIRLNSGISDSIICSGYSNLTSALRDLKAKYTINGKCLLGANVL